MLQSFSMMRWSLAAIKPPWINRVDLVNYLKEKIEDNLSAPISSGCSTIFFHRCDRECLHHIEAHMETWQHFDGYFKSDDDYRNIRNDIKKAKDFLALRRQEHESTD